MIMLILDSKMVFLYHDVLDGFIQHQVFKTKLGALGKSHFGFNNIMKLIFLRLLVATNLEICGGVCWIMWCLYLNKTFLSSSSWTFFNHYRFLHCHFHQFSWISSQIFNSYNFIFMMVDHLIKWFVPFFISK